MSILVFIHAKSEGPCALGKLLQQQGRQLIPVNLFAGDKVPPTDTLPDLAGVISMGGPMNVDQAASHPWINHEIEFLKAAHAARKPTLGVCLGAQLIADALAGQVAPMGTPDSKKYEVGWHNVTLTPSGATDILHAGLPWNSTQFHFHGQEVAKLPPDATLLASSQACKHQAFKVGQTTYAFQYHFEWDQADLQTALKDPFLKTAGLSSDEISKQTPTHYNAYRRLGDRLGSNIAATLFPLKN